MKKKSYRYHDMNWVEPAVTLLGGVAATAKALRVTQRVVRQWMEEGRVTDDVKASELGRQSKIGFKLIRFGPYLGTSV